VDDAEERGAWPRDGRSESGLKASTYPVHAQMEFRQDNLGLNRRAISKEGRKGKVCIIERRNMSCIVLSGPVRSQFLGIFGENCNCDWSLVFKTV
jgi:hypothetical protein